MLLEDMDEDELGGCRPDMEMPYNQARRLRKRQGMAHGNSSEVEDASDMGMPNSYYSALASGTQPVLAYLPYSDQ